MAISDLFSAEGVGNIMQDPRMVLGVQLMSQGRQGSGAQALGQAGSQAAQMLQQQQHSQQLAQYRQQMAAVQQQQLAMQQAQQQAKAEQAQRYQQQLQDPSFLASLSPMARQMAQLGVDPGELIRAQSADALAQHREAQLAQQAQQFGIRENRIGANSGGGGSSGPRAPTPRQILEEPIGDGMMQKHIYDAASGTYRKYGKPYPAYAPGNSAASADPLEAAIMEMTGGGSAASLPGTGNLQSYAPSQQPVGVMAPAAAPVQAAPQGMRVPGQPKVPAPKTKADYDALPSGSQYVDPVTGRIATKR